MRRLLLAFLLIAPFAFAGSGYTPPAGGAASDVSCTDCVTLGTETAGNYAGSASEGGAATTATALAANGANCSAASFPLGVDTLGAVESCTTLASSNAGTATALAADPADCAAGQIATGIAASGALSCTATPTVTGITTATITSTAADPADTGFIRMGSGEGLYWKHTTESSITDTAGVTTINSGAGSIIAADPITVPVGLVSAPSIAFDPDTGFYYAISAIRVAIDSSNVFSINATSIFPGSSNFVDNGLPALPWKNGYFQTAIQGASSKALVNNTATIFAKITTTSGSNFGGSVDYSIHDTDATNRSTQSGRVNWAVTNIGGTITCGITTTDTTAIIAGIAVGFANTFTCADAGSNILDLKATALTTGGTDCAIIKKVIAVISRMKRRTGYRNEHEQNKARHREPPQIRATIAR